MIESLKGIDQLVRTMNRLKDRTAAKAARAGLRAGLAELNKSVRRAVNGSSASPQLKAAARTAIGTRILKDSEANAKISGKGGFGVGLSGKRKRAKAAVRVANRRAKRGAKKGVGLSAANIHWFVLGTKERKTGAKQTRTWQKNIIGFHDGPLGREYIYGKGGKYRYYTKDTGNTIHKTGKLPAILAGVMKAAASSAGPAMIEAMRDKVQKVIASEVHSSQVPILRK